MMRCGNVEIRSVDFHISTRRRYASHGVCMGPWGEARAAFYSRSVPGWSPAAQHAIRGVRRNLRDDGQRHPDAKRAYTPSRGSLASISYAPASVAVVKTD